MYISIAFQSTSNHVNTHNKKLLTTSFGGSTTSEGYPGRILEKPRDKSEILGTQLCDSCVQTW